MAIDTANKRSSAIDVSSPWRSRLPFPDGSVGSDDRAHAAGYYSGLTVSGDAALSATGTGTAAFVGASTGGQQADGGGFIANRGSAYWRKYKAEGSKKKRKKLDQLDELLLEVKAKIEPWSQAKAYEQEQALLRDVFERGKALDEDDTLARIEAEIANLREVLADIDEEETLLLLLF